jgi:hypothetical protein
MAFLRDAPPLPHNHMIVCDRAGTNALKAPMPDHAAGGAYRFTAMCRPC